MLTADAGSSAACALRENPVSIKTEPLAKSIHRHAMLMHTSPVVQITGCRCTGHGNTCSEHASGIDIPSGIVPVIWFWSKAKTLRLVEVSHSAGSVPTMELLDRINSCRLGSSSSHEEPRLPVSRRQAVVHSL